MPSFFPLDVLDEIWGLTESVPEGFPTYFYLLVKIACYNSNNVYNNFTLCSTGYFPLLYSICLMSSFFWLVDLCMIHTYCFPNFPSAIFLSSFLATFPLNVSGKLSKNK